jgi:hypothetical protein
MVSITGQNNCGLVKEDWAVVVSWCEIAISFYYDLEYSM